MSSRNRKGLKPCRDCNGTGQCRRTAIHSYRGADGQQHVSHDAYGNPYGDHTCCGCKGVRFADCFHAYLTVHPSVDMAIHPPVVVCGECGFRWLGVPYQARDNEDVMFDVVMDAVREYIDDEKNVALRNRAMAMIDQLLEWHRAPAFEKQVTSAQHEWTVRAFYESHHRIDMYRCVKCGIETTESGTKAAIFACRPASQKQAP